MKHLIIFIIIISLTACATPSGKIESRHTSPELYSQYNCVSIVQNMRRIEDRINILAAQLDKAAKNDKLLVGAGMLLFWPALFAVGGTDAQEAEYARLKGEYEALRHQFGVKNCGAGGEKHV